MVSGSPKSRSPLAVRLALVGAATFFFAILAIRAPATYNARLTADEPQYLLTAISLWEDGDLDIADELAEERFLPFHEVALNPQTLSLNDSGQRLSPHDPLLPLLLAPATGLAGWIGAKVMLALIGAITAVATTWLAIRRYGVGQNTASLLVGAAFVSPPLTGYATQIYPEMPAALAVVVGLGALRSRRTGRADCVLALAVVALPWLAVKYVPLAFVLVAARLLPVIAATAIPGKWRTRSTPAARPAERGQTAALFAGLTVAGVVYLIAHQRIYGGWTVYAAGDHFVGGEFQVVGSDPDYAGRSRRLIGLLVDQSFGLVPWNPAYLFLAPALAVVAGRRRPGWQTMAALVVAGWAVATWVALTMHGWWWPGRQLVVVLPLAVVAIASLVDDHPLPRMGALVGFGLGAASWLWLVVEALTGRRTLIVDFAETSNPWYRLWSSLFPDHLAYRLTGTGLALTIAWTLGVVASAVIAWHRSSRSRAESRPESRPEAR